MEDSAMSSEESANSKVVKFVAIIGLEGMDGSTKLGGDVGEKGCEGGRNIGFMA
jgi:hypothetical protein